MMMMFLNVDDVGDAGDADVEADVVSQRRQTKGQTVSKTKKSSIIIITTTIKTSATTTAATTTTKTKYL